MKIPEYGKCYVCDAELTSVDQSEQFSQFEMGFGNGEGTYSFVGTMKDEEGEEVACCKKCIVGTLIMSAQTLTEIHGVDPKNIN